jgi:parallel beta-helix repeat protein
MLRMNASLRTTLRVSVLPAVLAVLALLPSLLPQPAARAPAAKCDRYAAVHGSNSAAGTVRRPVRSPEALVRVLRPGQTGCFHAGTYEFDVLDINERRITLTRYRRARVALEGDVKVLPSGAGAAIVGLRLNGAGGKNQIGPRIYADRVLLRNNTITNHHTGICVAISSFYSRPPPRGVLIRGNRVHDCGRLPATNHDHGIYVSHAHGTSIERNWIYDNADRGIQLYPSAQDTLVRGNVIDANGQGVSIGGDDTGVCSNGNRVAGNVITNAAISWNVYSGAQGPDCSGNVVTRNCLYARAAVHPYDQNGGVLHPPRNFIATGNLVKNPRYVDPESGDYRLRARSPCKRLLR